MKIAKTICIRSDQQLFSVFSDCALKILAVFGVLYNFLTFKNQPTRDGLFVVAFET